MNKYVYTTWEEAVLWLKKQKDQSSLVKDAYFDDPLTGAAERFYKGREWAAVKQYLPKKIGKVLDLGAGRGIASYAFASEGWKTVALEPDPSEFVGAGAIRQLRGETELNIEVVEEVGEKLPFNDETFSLIYCRQALHHADDLEKLCHEIGRVLKPQGIFIATREHVLSRKEDLTKFFEIHPLHGLYGGEYAYELKTYLHAITSAGIRVKKILNPFESDINLYPNTKNNLKFSIAQRLIFLNHKMIPDLLLKYIGRFDKTPGRLYSFVGYKI